MGVSAVILVAYDVSGGERMPDFTERSTDLTHVELVLREYISTNATKTPEKYLFGMFFSSAISTGILPLVLERASYIFTADRWRIFNNNTRAHFPKISALLIWSLLLFPKKNILG